MKKLRRVIIVPYNKASKGAKNLAQSLRAALKNKVLRVAPDSTTFKPRMTDFNINWGCSKEWYWGNNYKIADINMATNKYKSFICMSIWNSMWPELSINTPDWTDDFTYASKWIEDGHTVFARTILNGHSGQGIVVCTKETGLVPAPLYTLYKKKRHEYRVHIFKEKNLTHKVIDVTQKKKRKEAEIVNTQIRNHKNGWVYARQDIIEPSDLRTQALNAAKCFDLPFIAVDLIWNEYENKCYVLEVNTAPGIDGTTLQKYTDAIIGELK